MCVCKPRIDILHDAIIINKNSTIMEKKGKEKNARPETGLAHSVVIELTSYLQNKGYRVYTDNYYTSPE
jgi:hypothetical protein